MRAALPSRSPTTRFELGGGDAQPGHRHQDTRPLSATRHCVDDARPTAVLDAPGRRRRARARRPTRSRRAAALDRLARGAPRARRRAARRRAACATRSSRSRARRARCRPRSSATRRCSTPLRDADALRGRARPSTAYRERRCGARRRTTTRRALRRWKRREFLRIAARDLLGLADLPTVGRELAALAEVCLGAALALAEPDDPVRGHRHGQARRRRAQLRERRRRAVRPRRRRQPRPTASRVRVLATMTEPTADGIVFRTDADLRPEGRAGRAHRAASTRYAAWYERWAQTWEFQALHQGAAGRRRRRARRRVHRR